MASLSDASTAEEPFLVALLRERKLLDQAKLEQVIREQGKRNCSFEEALALLNLVPPETIAKLYSEQLEVPLFEPPNPATATNPTVPPAIGEALKKQLSEKFLRTNHVLPIGKEGDSFRVAFLNPTDFVLVQELQLYIGLPIAVHVATLAAIDKGLDALYGISSAAKDLAEEAQSVEVGVSSEGSSSSSDDLLDLDKAIPETKETKVIRMVNQIMIQAIREKASDIHLEPYPDEVKIRLRIDGVLNEIPAPPPNLFPSLISRFKILAKMDIAEKRVPLDGALSMKLAGVPIDVRVSTVPTVHGEKMVMRLLNKEAVPLKLELLGFDARQCSDFLEAARSPHGLLFVTGPTGSGKSTTLYATLNLVRSPKKNILTVEDPVEYKFAGINQVQVKPQVELTFARALRAFLRQDPDVIMVGEVRDNETAQICLRAALTGHFVLSTLHTNDALSATTRLMDMGIEPFMLASTLRLVEAQRLIRRLCPKCKEPYRPGNEIIEKYQMKPDITLYRGKGCKECKDVGYKGRIGIFEVIRITPSLRDLIQERAPLPKMTEAAHKDGMKTLADNGLIKVQEGLTSLEEVIAVTVEGGH